MTRYEIPVAELAAYLVDVGRVLEIPDEGQREHLASLGLTAEEIELAIGGTIGYYEKLDQTAQPGGNA